MGGKVIGIDRDIDSVNACRSSLRNFIDNKQLSVIHGNFGDAHLLLPNNDLYKDHKSVPGVGKLNGVLMDLGVSSHQLNTKSRGFAHSLDGPLDMRMNSSTENILTAHEIVNTYDVESLANMFYTYGNEPLSRQISREIVSSRPINSTSQLRDVIGRIIPSKYFIKTCSKCFQAIRIVINQEMDELRRALCNMHALVAPPVLDEHDANVVHRSRVVVISYHSLEDRMVKQWSKYGTVDMNKTNESLAVNKPSKTAREQVFSGSSDKEHFKTLMKHKNALLGQKNRMHPWRIVNKEVITPDGIEVAANNRSRSAKLRVVEYVV